MNINENKISKFNYFTNLVKTNKVKVSLAMTSIFVVCSLIYFFVESNKPTHNCNKDHGFNFNYYYDLSGKFFEANKQIILSSAIILSIFAFGYLGYRYFFKGLSLMSLLKNNNRNLNTFQGLKVWTTMQIYKMPYVSEIDAFVRKNCPEFISTPVNFVLSIVNWIFDWTVSGVLLVWNNCYYLIGIILLGQLAYLAKKLYTNTEKITKIELVKQTVYNQYKGIIDIFLGFLNRFSNAFLVSSIASAPSASTPSMTRTANAPSASAPSMTRSESQSLPGIKEPLIEEIQSSQSFQ